MRQHKIVDYDLVVIPTPEEKPTTEFTTEERRATIYQMIKERGFLRISTQKSLALQFGVCQQMIHKDIEFVKEFIRSRIGENADVYSQLVFEKGAEYYLAQGQYLAAAKMIEYWNNWLFDTGRQERASKKIELTQTTVSKEIREYKATFEFLKKLPREEADKIKMVILNGTAEV